MDRYKKYIDNDRCMYTIIVLVSAIVFCLIFGIKILNPLYTDWLIIPSWCRGGIDIGVNYLGWKAYRNSAWSFPIGMVNNLIHPTETSIIYTDSIPLLAFIFKILSPILPASFQYFGLWGIICFILQGVLSAKLINRFSPNRMITILSSIIFLFTPVMLTRMYYHSALAGQWIILWTLDFIFNADKYTNKKKFYLTIVLLGVFTASIHMYFAVMIGFILCGYTVLEIYNKKRVTIIQPFMGMAVYVVTTLTVLFLFGGFSSNTNAVAEGLGHFNFNLNGFVNPLGISSFIKPLPYVGKQDEGFAYLGIGCILLFIIACVIFAFSRKRAEIFRNNRGILIALSVTCLLSFAFAISIRITFNEHIITNIYLPNIIFSVESIFRATGRIIWVCVYIIMIASIITVIKLANRKWATALLIAVIIIQIIDIKPLLSKVNTHLSSDFENEYVLDSEAWDVISQNDNIAHVVCVSNFDFFQQFCITDWALTNNQTVNYFFFARDMMGLVVDNRIDALSNISEDSVFLFTMDDIDLCENYDLHYYVIDGIIVGYKTELNGLSEINVRN